jgi:hypothetical protein
MFTKTIIAAALVTLASSGAVYAGLVYQGGPKSNSTMSVAPSQTFEIKKPYARYEPGTPVRTNRHIYRGGPKADSSHER